MTPFLVLELIFSCAWNTLKSSFWIFIFYITREYIFYSLIPLIINKATLEETEVTFRNGQR